MNNRIRELAKKAGFSTELSEAVATRHNTTSAFEKFAELIVLECAKLVDQDWHVSGAELREHFGVEK